MHKLVISALIIFVYFSSYLPANAQSINIGLDVNAYSFIREHKKFDYQTSIQKSESTDLAVVPLPVGYFVNVGVNFSNEISANIKGGLLGFPDMFGPQLGAEARYKFDNGVELIIPYVVHFNDASGGNSSGQSMNTIHLLGLGVGKNLTRVTSLELVYLKAVNSETQISWSTDHLETIGATYLNSLIKLGIRFNWSVF